MDTLKVSVVTPSLNQGKFIRDNLESVLSQDYPHIEHIIVDGGSNDETTGILQEFARTHGNSMRWISEPDSGQSDAVNKGLEMATGQIIAWLNADDTYPPGAVQIAAEFLASHPNVAMVYGECNFVNEKGEKIGKFPDSIDFDYRLLTQEALNFIPQPAVFFRRDLLRTVGLLDVNLHMAMDYDLWLRIGKRYQVRRIPRILANFRLSPRSKSVANWWAFWPEVLTVLIRHCGLKPIRSYFRRYYKAAQTHGYGFLQAFEILEHTISEELLLQPYRAEIRAMGLSQALLARAGREYLWGRRRCGLRDLVLSLRTDCSVVRTRDFLTLAAKLLLGPWMATEVKSIFNSGPTRF